MVEAAIEGALLKKMFLIILQYSQENTCVGVAGLEACNFIKKRLNQGAFLWILGNF